jgi:hypothetical protein
MVYKAEEGGTLPLYGVAPGHNILQEVPQELEQLNSLTPHGNRKLYSWLVPSKEGSKHRSYSFLFMHTE